MTFQKKFEYLNKKYAQKTDISKLTENFAAQIEMTDDDCNGIFYIAFFDGNFSCEPYDYRDNTVAITINSVLLEEILTGKADAVEAFFAGKIEVDGSARHAQMLIEAMKQNKAKKTTRKTTKKETAATEEASTEKKTTRKKSTKKEA